MLINVDIISRKRFAKGLIDVLLKQVVEAQEEEDAEEGESIETQGMRALAQLPHHQQVRLVSHTLYHTTHRTLFYSITVVCTNSNALSSSCLKMARRRTVFGIIDTTNEEGIGFVHSQREVVAVSSLRYNL